ncbi:MAG: GNAT family N-acetyltransferase [Peptostreptococcus sp.]|uniref:GNAT family N-acetyltransferase n=1 Tax=Peptostreptococcus sp. TaxID=1262 RepID=UPI002FC80081
MKIRKYQPKDLNDLVNLFTDTIINVNIKDYSKSQVNAWSSSKHKLLNNPNFFTDLYTIVAIIDENIVGYGNIDSNGYLDHLFVHHNFQGQGIASRICDILEEYARQNSIKKIQVHSSISAKNFFKDRGYQVEKPQLVALNKESFVNFSMFKVL